MGAVTTKIILREDKKDRQGKCPLYLRVTYNRKTKYSYLDLKIDAKFWIKDKGRVKSSYPNSVRFNNRLAKVIYDAESKILEAHEARTHPLGLSKSTDFNNDFFLFADHHLQMRMSEEKIGTHDKEKAIIQKLRRYVGKGKFEFRDITIEFLDRYKVHLQKKYKNKVNTIHSNFKTIRTIFNKAEKYGLVIREYNPFIYYKLKKEATSREFLTLEELRKIRELELDPSTMIYHHRQLFLFACSACGLRVSDLLTLRPEHIQDGYLDLQMSKVAKRIRFKLLPEANAILDEYFDKNERYVFPLLQLADKATLKERDKKISRCTSLYNKNLKIIASRSGINKHLTSHVARHTFATLSLSQGLRIEYVSRLLGHSSIRTTQIYSKIIDQDLETEMQKLSFS